MADIEIQKHLDKLYSLPRETFTAERNALAKELKQDGATEESAAITRLRKPTLAAWALNQVARAQREEVERLFSAQAEMEQASSADALRRAGERRQELIARLSQRSVQMLEEGGHGGQAARDKIVMTLLALGTNAQAAEEFRRGQLTDDVEPASSWDLALAHAAATPAESGAAPARSRSNARAKQELDRLIEKAEQAEKRAEQAAGRLEEAKKEAKASAAAARKARQEADRKAAALEN